MTSQEVDDSVARTLSEFGEYSTAHGLRRLVRQTKVLGRIVWILFLLGAYGGFGFHLYTLVLRYQSVPLLTSLTTTTPYQFPDVYLCPTNILSMSKLSTMFNLTNDKQKIRGLKKDCNITCQARLTKYDVNVDSDLSLSTQALANATTTAEEAITQYFNKKNYANFSDCRYTLSGQEYIGNKTTVPVFFDSNLVAFNVTSVNYATQAVCIPWNTAAKKLMVANATALGGRILALNFSETDNKCREPSGLPLSSFFAIASMSVARSLGCYSDDTSNRQFNFSCFQLDMPGMTIEVCTECCYNRNFSYMAVQGSSCYCGQTQGKVAKVREEGCDAECPGNSDQTCGGSDDLVSVYRIKSESNSSTPLYIPYGSQLTSNFQGPFCFYTDPAYGLAASYCNVPYCPLPAEFDCSTTSTEDSESNKQKARYSGRVSVTAAQMPCLVWADVKRGVENGSLLLPQSWHSWDSNYAAKRVVQLTIQTPDYELSNQTNYCRAVLVLSDTVYTADSGPSAFVRETVYQDFTPGCFYQNKAEGTLAFEECTIDSCYLSIPAVPGVIRDRVGSALLYRQFSNDLAIGLVGCQFNNKTCTAADFQEVLHPELGVCHRFAKDPLLKNLTTAEIADTTLSVQLFTDATDSRGATLKLQDMLESAVSSSNGPSEDSPTSMTVVVVPDGMFPWAYLGTPVTLGNKLDMSLTLGRTERYPKPPVQDCNRTEFSAAYVIDSWKQVTLSDATVDKLDTMASSVLQEKDWVRKIDALKNLLNNYSDIRGPMKHLLHFEIANEEDCINEQVLLKFAASCRCLPTTMPIPEHLYEAYPLCFNGTNIEELYNTGLCYNRQKELLQSYRNAAKSRCQSMCASRSYSISQISRPWLNLRRETALNYLTRLAKKFGYPNSVRMTRGPVSLYSAYLTAQEIALGDVGRDFSASELMNFEYELGILQDRLTALTVASSAPMGEERVEEVEYQFKTLIAEMGGILGLWTGVSILTICEFIELVVLLCTKPCRKKSRQGNSADECDCSLNSKEYSSSAYEIPETRGPASNMGYANSPAENNEVSGL